MKDLEREAERLLACYQEEERPPPAIDARIRARLRREASTEANHRWLVLGLLAAAAALVLLGPAVLPRYAGPDDSAALHGMEPANQQGTVSSPNSPKTDPPVTATPLESDEDPGVAALRIARELLRAGSYRAVYERLEPCPDTVGSDDLREECEFLIARALCGAGELAQGRRRIVFFREHWPQSIHTRELSSLCP